MSKGRTSLYVYYRADSERSCELAQAVAEMQALLERGFSVKGSLQRRPHAVDGRYTWMEIYADVPADFESALHEAVIEAKLDLLIDGPRHTEVFVDATECA